MAKMTFCWRCKMEMPMLEEHEWRQIYPLLRQMFVDDGLAARGLYQLLTDYDETNVNAIWHHRIAQYGPPCEACGKPYRTPQAKYCAACGHVRPVALNTGL